MTVRALGVKDPSRAGTMFAERGQRIVNLLIGRDPNSVEQKKCSWKMRFLYGALIGSLLATIFWLSAVCANQWVYWEIPVGGIFLPGTTTLLEAQHAGMWQSCRKVRFHEGNVTTKCK